jgi:catalase
MISKRIPHSFAAALVCVFAVPVWGQEVDAEAIVKALFAIGGDHPNVRASGAKGICVKGTFAPSAEARTISKAPHFTKTVPVTARFSMGGSNPNISDKAKPVTRGFAIRFSHETGDLVLLLISAPVFSSKTPQQLLDSVTVRLPGSDGKPNADRITAFTVANPETTNQAAWLNARPVPASFAGVDYWAVHAYTLINDQGEAKVAKLKAVAAVGQLGLSDDELKARSDNFYIDEFKDRLGKGAVAFDLIAILGELGDPTDDLTAAWPEQNRKSVKLGLLEISAVEPNATCNAATFDPVTNLPEGIVAPNDPMFEIRSPTYAISLSRRTP